jgi:hypothetical protein
MPSWHDGLCDAPKRIVVIDSEEILQRGHGGGVGISTIPQSRSLRVPLRIDLPAFLLDIVTDGNRTDHC